MAQVAKELSIRVCVCVCVCVSVCVCVCFADLFQEITYSMKEPP